MDSFKYAFYCDEIRKGRRGGAQNVVFDTEALIASHLGFAPAYNSENWRAVSDEDCLIVSVAGSAGGGVFPNLSGMLDDDRWQKIFVRHSLDPAVSEKEDTLGEYKDVRNSTYVLEASFAPFNRRDKATFNSRTLFFPIQVLPSRVTPQAIEEAKTRYLSVDANRKKFSGQGPITVLVIGDLSVWGNDRVDDLTHMQWSKRQRVAHHNHSILLEIEKLKTLLTQRGGHAVLTTSLRTRAERMFKIDVEARLIEALRPWIRDLYIWDENERKKNPYLAFLGLADEIAVTGDSSSMISDVAQTLKPSRIMHGWQDLRSAKNDDPAKRLVSQMQKLGVPMNLDRMDISPPPRLNTGIPEALEGICSGMWAWAERRRLGPSPGLCC